MMRRTAAALGLGLVGVSGCQIFSGLSGLEAASGGGAGSPSTSGGTAGSGGSGGSGTTSATTGGGGTGGMTASSSSSSSSTSSSCPGNLTACGSSCVDTSSSASDCGSCGHDCQGGACQLGVCQPVLLASGLNLFDGSGLAVDAAHVYVGTVNALVKVPTGGGMPVTFANDKYVNAIALDATNLYYAFKSSLIQRSLGAGSSIGLYDPGSGGDQSAIALDPTYVHWFIFSSGRGSRVPIGGGPPTSVTNLPSPYGLAVDATSTYWTESNLPGRVRRINHVTTAQSDVATGLIRPSGLVVDGATLYFATLTGLRAVGVGGGTVTMLSARPTGQTRIAQDAAGIYFTDGSDVVRVAKDGSATTTLASGQGNALGIAVDATSIYWLDKNSGAVMKVAK